MTLPREPNFNLPYVPLGYSFLDDDGAFGMIPLRLGALLRGLISHTHDGVANELDAPTDPPDADLALSGGTIPAGGSLFYAYTLVDTHGRESVLSDPVEVELPALIGQPGTPALSYASTGGTLLSGSYAYMVSAYVGDSNHESLTGEPAQVVIAPVTTTNAVTLLLPDLPAGATGWNIYRYRPGSNGVFVYLASTTSTSYVDDGSDTEDAERVPPYEDTSGSSNAITVTLPGATPSVPSGYTWRLYRTSISGDWSRSLIHWVVEETSEGSGVITPTFEDTGYATQPVTPPDAAQTVPNPGKVDLTDGAHVMGVLPLGFMTSFIEPAWFKEGNPTGIIAVGGLLGQNQILRFYASVATAPSHQLTVRLSVSDPNPGPLVWNTLVEATFAAGEFTAGDILTQQLGGASPAPALALTDANAVTTFKVEVVDEDGENQVIHLAITGGAGGTLALTPPGFAAVTIPYNVTEAALLALLEAEMGVGNVEVTETAANEFDIECTGTLRRAANGAFVLDDALLTPPGNATITTVNAGVAGAASDLGAQILYSTKAPQTLPTFIFRDDGGT